MYKVTVLGSLGAEGYSALKKGAVVDLVPEPTNPVDSNAVAVYVDSGKGPVKAGYIANARETVLPGTMSATELTPLVASKKVAKSVALLTDEGFMTNSSGQQQKRFRAKAYFVPVRAQKKAKAAETKTYSVGGSSVLCQRRPNIMAELTKGNGKAKLALTIKRYISTDAALEKKGFFLYEEGKSDACGQLIVPEGDKLVEKFFKDNDELPCVTTGELNQVQRENGSTFTEYTVDVTFEPKANADYGKYVDEAIGRCCGQEKELQAKLTFLQSANVSKGVIEQFFALIRPQMDMGRVPKKPERPYMSKSANLNDVLVATFMHKPICLIGQKGSGKNTLVETVCWLINQPMVRVQGNSDMDKMDITGTPSLVDGNTEFELSPVMAALQGGCTVVMDEANLIPPQVLGILHSATDTARSVLIPGYGLVKLGEWAQVVYTLNEGYVGTSEMNEATVDRAVPFVLEPEVRLANILDGYPKDQVAVCQKVSDKIRKAVAEGTVGPEAVTIRGYIDALDMAKFIPLQRALVRCVGSKPQDETMRSALESIIRTEC